MIEQKHQNLFQVDSPLFAAIVAAAAPLQLCQEDPVHQPLGLTEICMTIWYSMTVLQQIHQHLFILNRREPEKVHNDCNKYSGIYILIN